MKKSRISEAQIGFVLRQAESGTPVAEIIPKLGSQSRPSPAGRRGALGRGASLADIMKVLGHSHVETTLKYVPADFERMRKAVGVLEEKTLTKKAKTSNISALKAEDQSG